MADFQEHLFPGNEAAFAEAKGLLREHSKPLSAFVGAGASIPIHPSWNSLLKELLGEVRSKCLMGTDDIEFCATLVENDVLEAVSQIENAVGREIFRSKISKRFGLSPEAFSDLQGLIIDLPFRSIFTTNYDSCLEAAHACAKSTAAQSFNLQHSFSLAKWNNNEFDQNSRPILHLHGQSVDPNTMVLTKEDYIRVYQDPEFIRCMEGLWSREHLVLIGFGFNDPFLSMAVERLLTPRFMEERHFAFVGSTKKISAMERRVFRQRFRVNPIFYEITSDAGKEDHAKLLRLLKEFELPDQVEIEDQNVDACKVIPEASQGNIVKSTQTDSLESIFERSLFFNGRGKIIYVEPRIYTPINVDAPPDQERERVDVNSLVQSKESYFLSGKSEYGRTTLCNNLNMRISRAGGRPILRSASVLPNYKKKLAQSFGEEIASGKNSHYY